MTLFLINLSSVVCAIAMVFAALELYRLTRSNGLLVLFIASLYLTTVRLLIAGCETFAHESAMLEYRSHLVAPYWPMMAVGFLLLLHSLRSMYGSGGHRMRDKEYDDL